jgi:N-formylglutamate deformylase
MHAFDFTAGTLPLLVSMPHVGTDIPTNIAPHFTPDALQKPDTDWHLPRLYDFLAGMGASVIAARWSRYVIDLNRPANDTNLYPGQDTTGLCPLDTFGKARLYLPGYVPDQSEIEHRLRKYWQPYHSQLASELQRLLALHGKVVLWDAHSIASQVPRFFSGKLPDLNLGSADGKSCDAGLMAAVVQTVQQQSTYTLAVNGRFKGGHITRHYGLAGQGGQAGGQGIHSLQLEMCQSTYMDETPPFGYRPDLADGVKPLLQQMVQAAIDWVRT